MIWRLPPVSFIDVHGGSEEVAVSCPDNIKMCQPALNIPSYGHISAGIWVSKVMQEVFFNELFCLNL